MKNKLLPLFFLLLAARTLSAQQDFIPVTDNLVIEGIPPLRASYIAEVKSYTESRSATLVDWNPVTKGMLISTRFANSNQLHYVKFPGGDRRQITFFDEPVNSATFDPIKGEYFIFLKDVGGNEFLQLYRYDLVNSKITLLTDGKRSQNGGIQWNNKGDLIAYGSTKRNGQDRDIYIMNPLDPMSDRRIIENKGGGWSVVGWAPDDATLIMQESISINESRLYQVNVATGTKKRLIPENDERSTYYGICYSKDGKGIYLVTNREGEFNQLVYLDLSNRKLKFITGSIPWDVENGEISKDGSKLAFVTNENGLSKLYILSTATNEYSVVPNIPTGLIGTFKWYNDSKSIGMTFSSYNSLSDVFEYNTKSGELIRWTESELGGMDVSALQEPQLISWKSFDGRTISGYLYKASDRFTGKRPVMIVIHGGPEGQSYPSFQGRSNYYLNELGISLIYPNVRGSTGYGKTFVDLDNGMKREESVKDIGALIDWIGQHPDLDKERIMVAGGSYGGYMTLAVSYLYSDKIRCSIDVVGISNFNTFMKNTEAYRRDLRRAEYGDERDSAMAAFFESTAPMNHTDKIIKPLFIVQGGNDPRVPYTESIQMKEKIQQNGGAVWFLLAKDEGHGFRKKNNVDFQFYSTIEFIKKFLLNDD